jgi:O-antigen/teichoic acid export membrane protein
MNSLASKCSQGLNGIYFKFKSRLFDPLVRNSLYLMLNSLLGTSTGFIFWAIAAKYYSASDVGLGVALISSMNLITLFSKLGLDIAIIKFLPSSKDKNTVINSYLTIIAFTTTILVLFYLYNMNLFSPDLVFMKETIFLKFSFFLFTLSNVLFMAYTNIYIALRNAKYSFLQSLIAMIRVFMLPFFSIFSVIGLFASYSISLLLACTIGINFIKRIDRTYRPAISIQYKCLFEMFNFAFGNYLASLLEGMPSFLLPLIVLKILGPESNAYFYMAWAFSMVLLMVPKSTSLSLFAEGEHERNEFTKKIFIAIKLIISLLVPLIILYFVFGKILLSIIGDDYANNAYQILCIFSLSSIPYSINNIYVTIERVNKKNLSVIVVYALISFLTIIGSYFSMKQYGLIGVAIAWFLSNSFVCVLICILMFNYHHMVKGVFNE